MLNEIQADKKKKRICLYATLLILSQASFYRVDNKIATFLLVYCQQKVFLLDLINVVKSNEKTMAIFSLCEKSILKISNNVKSHKIYWFQLLNPIL